ncbi:MAG: TPM domain-containing protein [Salinivirgaceae bacterium]|nr:TPM domain-containing protein [Salinivirgaceae bacterium]
MSIKNFFSETGKQEILDAIKKAEQNTSGEIRVHIESKCKGETLDRASTIFNQLKMHKTELRNGVLFYVSIDDRKFAILGDAGINAKVPDGFWDDITTMVISKFQNNEYAVGLASGIIEAGNQLKKHFPHQSDDINELSDDISFGE